MNTPKDKHPSKSQSYDASNNQEGAEKSTNGSGSAPIQNAVLKLQRNDNKAICSQLHQHKQRSPSEESSTSTQLLGGKYSLKQRIDVKRCDLKWAQQLVTEHHYLHRPIHPLSIPFAYSISLDDVVVGTIIMAIPHFTKKKGLFGYEDLPTKWQVLQIARLWIDPKYQIKQSNGHASNIASCAIAKVLKRVNHDWLEHHPPKYLDQPYKIKLIISYADTSVGHQGTIYRAANFQKWGETTNNRPRHGNFKGSKEPKILYIYRLNRKSKPLTSTPKVLLGGEDNSPLSTIAHTRFASEAVGLPKAIDSSSVNKEISIPCLVKQPKQTEVKGVIKEDKGDRFVVDVDGERISVSKLFVYPDFSKTVGQIEKNPRKSTTPSKENPRKSRRKKDRETERYIIALLLRKVRSTRRLTITTQRTVRSELNTFLKSL